MGKKSQLVKRVHRLLDRLDAVIPHAAPDVDWDAHVAFRWRRQGERAWLEGIDRLSPVQLSDLLHVDRQKNQLDQNTRQFVHGLPANNALLWGPRGTGKSSLIKAILNAYSAQGLRLIEIEKKHLDDLPDLAEMLYARSEKFLIYCDDLSFEDHDTSYKALKVILDGSINATPDNVLIYASSNRRHLVPEYTTDNENAKLIETEIHYGEAVEEKISLSERFGLWLAFHPFNQEAYLTIVKHWLAQLGVEIEDDSHMRAEALRWALSHGSRSGRSAWQFARDYAGKQALQNLEKQNADSGVSPKN